MLIKHNSPCIDTLDIQSVMDVMRSGYIAEGPVVEQFEKEFGLKNVIPYCRAVINGTSAIYLGLLALKIEKGDEVLLPTYVCSALLNAIFMVGAKPVLADIMEDDFNISVLEIYKKITKKTKAIIIPHIHGMPFSHFSDIPEGISVLEDCATAIGSCLNGIPVGNSGNISIFSFYATKYITTGNGGMVCTHDAAIDRFVGDYREFDCCSIYKPRFNFQMGDLQASLGLSQLKRLEEIKLKRKIIAARYKEFFKEKGIEWQKADSDSLEYNNYRLIIRIDNKNRDRIKDGLEKMGISCIIPIDNYELLHNYLHLSSGSFPVAEKIAASTLSMPIYPSLKENELDYVIECLTKIV